MLYCERFIGNRLTEKSILAKLWIIKGLLTNWALLNQWLEDTEDAGQAMRSPIFPKKAQHLINCNFKIEQKTYTSLHANITWAVSFNIRIPAPNLPFHQQMKIHIFNSVTTANGVSDIFDQRLQNRPKSLFVNGRLSHFQASASLM